MFSEMVARTLSLELKLSSWQDSALLVEKVKAPFSRCRPPGLPVPDDQKSLGKHPEHQIPLALQQSSYRPLMMVAKVFRPSGWVLGHPHLHAPAEQACSCLLSQQPVWQADHNCLIDCTLCCAASPSHHRKSGSGTLLHQPMLLLGRRMSPQSAPLKTYLPTVPASLLDCLELVALLAGQRSHLVLPSNAALVLAKPLVEGGLALALKADAAAGLALGNCLLDSTRLLLLGPLILIQLKVLRVNLLCRKAEVLCHPGAQACRCICGSTLIICHLASPAQRQRSDE